MKAKPSTRIRTFVLGEFEANCFVLIRDSNAILVDPGAEPDTLAAFIDSHHLTVSAFLLTHGHMDHVSAIGALSRRFPAPVHLHPADLTWAFTPANAWEPHYPQPEPPAGDIVPLSDNQTLTIAGLSLRVLSTPGHSPGSVCFFIESEARLLTGDTLFAGSVGRTDFPGGSSSQMQASLHRLCTLPDDTAIFPGHGILSTIGRERLSNPFLSGLNHPAARTINP